MIAHQHPGLDLPPGALAGLAQGVKEKAVVVIVEENGFAPIAPGHDVVASTGQLEANAAGHHARYGPE
jgi:hypothetical protein